MLTFAFIDIQVASCQGKGLLFASWGREEGRGKDSCRHHGVGWRFALQMHGVVVQQTKGCTAQSWLQKIVHGTEAVMTCPAISLLSYAAEWIFCEPSWI